MHIFILTSSSLKLQFYSKEIKRYESSTHNKTLNPMKFYFNQKVYSDSNEKYTKYNDSCLLKYFTDFSFFFHKYSNRNDFLHGKGCYN